ncbi:MAG: ATPase [Oscillospiraceae bacterium]
MITKDNKLQFFSGANSSKGFINNFLQFYTYKEGYNCYIIKAGPGCGKSTMMKKIGQKLLDKGFKVYHFPCTADPNSLDCVFCPELKFVIADGTAPHITNPK